MLQRRVGYLWPWSLHIIASVVFVVLYDVRLYVLCFVVDKLARLAILGTMSLVGKIAQIAQLSVFVATKRPLHQ